MKHRIKLVSSPALVREYRRLLTSDWSGGLDHATDIIALIRRHLLASGLQLQFYWEALPRKSASSHPPRLLPIPEEASEALREFLERSNAMARERLKAVERPSEPDDLYQVAYQAWSLLTWQQDWDMPGSYGLFRDTQSLLYLSAIHDVLPALHEAGRLREHALLVQAMLWHATSVWHDEVAHSLHLQACLHDHLGQVETALEQLYTAFRLTSPSEHEFLTRAQAYWSMLLEVGATAQARQFALDLYREAPLGTLREVQELVSQSYCTAELQVRDK